jgi:competence protein ComEC
MLFIGWILLIFGLELISFKLLFFTTFLVIAIFPKLLFSYSFLLSVAGVYYIFLILKWQKESFNLLKTIFIIPIGVFILMFPISHYIFPNSSIWQLASPILSVLFIIFYPLSLILHLLGYGDLFDNILSSLLILPRESVNIIMPIGLFTIYLILSIFAIFSKKVYIATFILALLITIWYMLLL